MRYNIEYNKLVNRFVPHYLGGRKLVLYLQSVLSPLQDVNDEWAEWARETRIEASMTSQVFKLEWFLNRKFQQYFQHSADRISIHNGHRVGTPIYHQDATLGETEEHLLLYQQSEISAHGSGDVRPRSLDDPTVRPDISDFSIDTTALYYANDIPPENLCSFVVSSPAINTNKISQEEYHHMLTYYIDKYKLASKTYIIKYSE